MMMLRVSIVVVFLVSWAAGGSEVMVELFFRRICCGYARERWWN